TFERSRFKLHVRSAEFPALSGELLSCGSSPSASAGALVRGTCAVDYCCFCAWPMKAHWAGNEQPLLLVLVTFFGARSTTTAVGGRTAALRFSLDDCLRSSPKSSIGFQFFPHRSFDIFALADSSRLSASLN